MDTKKKRSGGFGSIFFMIIIIGIVWAVIAQITAREQVIISIRILNLI